jgi:hypothetical protein
MTEQEWKRRCLNRIYNAVKTAGKIRVRDLKRRTHYNRWHEGEGVRIWYEALESLERRKYVVVQRDYENTERAVALPEIAVELGWTNAAKANMLS